MTLFLSYTALVLAVNNTARVRYEGIEPSPTAYEAVETPFLQYQITYRVRYLL